jgi:hypothetical protein
MIVLRKKGLKMDILTTKKLSSISFILPFESDQSELCIQYSSDWMITKILLLSFMVLI